MKTRSMSVEAIVWLLAAAPAVAGELTVTDAWSRTTPPGIPVGVAYLTIRNGSAKSDRLLRLRTPVASSVEVHRTETVAGVARMREVSVLHLAPGETVRAEPGGMHLMLMGLEKPLVAEQKFELEMLFEAAGPRKIIVLVRNP